MVNPKRLLTPWLCVFLFLVAVDSRHNQKSNEQLNVKIKLLRKALHNQQWEVDQAHSRNGELDMMRWYWQATNLRHREWAQIIETIYRKANEYGLRPSLMLAVAHRESNFDPLAQSSVAMGIMQINYAVWADTMSLNSESVLDIETNIEAACKIMRMYLDEAGGDEIKALNYYNCGYSMSNPRYVPRIMSSKFWGVR
jgi:soluble lytic murein transglycosylase-like protein